MKKCSALLQEVVDSFDQREKVSYNLNCTGTVTSRSRCFRAERSQAVTRYFLRFNVRWILISHDYTGTQLCPVVELTCFFWWEVYTAVRVRRPEAVVPVCTMDDRTTVREVEVPGYTRYIVVLVCDTG